MNAYLLLTIEGLISLIVSSLVLTMLSQPLSRVLVRLCPDAQAAQFWVSYTKIMLTIAPLLLVLVVDMATHFADPMDNIRLALIAVLGGLLLGLHIVGKRLGQFVQPPVSDVAPTPVTVGL